MSKSTVWVPSAIPFILFGAAYYLVSPAFVLHFMSDDYDLLYVATKYLDSSYFDVSYFSDAIIILTSFLAGYSLAKFCTKPKISLLDYGSYQLTSSFLLAISFCLLVVYFGLSAAASGAGIFTGYSTYNIAILGPFSTIAFMSVWFVNYFSKKIISYIFLSFYVICSVLLLGWGARMFFVLSFMALMLGLVSKNRKLLKNLWVHSFILIFGLLVVGVGIVRGGDEISSDKLMAVFFAEPLFTSITGALYFENSGGRPVYSAPYDLYASIIHFIPSAVYPGKVELISAITYDENIMSPFGAKGLLVNLYSNFGYFYPIFVVFIGFYYGFLYKKAQNSVFFRATYFSALPILMFYFYREGLPTIIKVMYFNGLVVPLFVSLLLIWLSPRTIADIKSRISHNKA